MKHTFPPDCPKRLQDLIGRKVRIRREMSNNLCSIPAGTVMEVAFSTRWAELRLIGPPCACCKVAPVMNAVDIRDVTMVLDADMIAAAE